MKKQVVWSVGGRVSVALSNLLMTILFANFSTNKIHGEFLFAISVLGITSILTVPGVNTVVFRESAAGNHGCWELATKFSIKASLLSSGVLLCYAGWIFTKNLNASLMYFGLAILVPFYFSMRSWEVFAKGLGYFEKLSLSLLCRSLFVVVVTSASILFFETYEPIVLINVGATVLANLILYRLFRKYRTNMKIGTGWKRESFGLSFLDFSTIVYSQIDSLLIGTFLSAKDLSIYGTTMKLGNAFMMVVRSGNEVLVRKIFSDGNVSWKLFAKVFIGLCALVVLVNILMPHIIPLVFSERYSATIQYLQWFLVAIPIYFLVSSSSGYMILKKLVFDINLSRAVSTGVALMAYLTLIPRFGIWGGIVGSVSYFATSLVMNAYLLKRSVNRS